MNMEKEKTTKTSTKKEKGRHCAAVLDFYEDTYTFRSQPVSKAFFEKLGPEFVKFVEDDKTVIHFIEFANSKRIPERTFGRWCKEQEDMIKAAESVRSMLKVRLRKGLFFGTMKEKGVMYSMHTYDEEWDAMDQRWNKMRQEEEGKKDTTIVVEMGPLKAKEEK